MSIFWGPSLDIDGDGGFSTNLFAPSALSPIHWLKLSGDFTGRDVLKGTYGGYDSLEGLTRCPLRGAFFAKKSSSPTPQLKFRTRAGEGPRRHHRKRHHEPRRCVRSGKVIKIRLRRSKYPAVVRHIRAAIAHGWPRILRINRHGADARRRRALKGIPTRAGQDRDEYPPASLRGRGKGLERGRKPRGWKAHVDYVPSRQNRGAGAVQRHRIKRYCNRQRVRFTFPSG